MSPGCLELLRAAERDLGAGTDVLRQEGGPAGCEVPGSTSGGDYL